MPGSWTNWELDPDFAKDFKVELWDVVQAELLTDAGVAQGEGLLRRPGLPHARSI